MPKALICVAAGQLEWHDYDEPSLADGQVRIGARFAAAKHGTELAFYKGYAAARGPLDETLAVFAGGRADSTAPGPIRFAVGNMVVGTVLEAAADAGGLGVGDRVLAYSGFRPTVVRAAVDCWKLPAELAWQSAVCLDPADFALGAIRDGHVRVGDAVAVFGMGAIGLMGVQLAKVAGASPVIAVEPLPGRRALAERLGADVALDPSACDAGREIKLATRRRGADVAIEYSGSRLALQAALRGVAYGGTVVAGAFPPPYDAGLDLGAEAHVNVPNLVFSRSCSEPNRDAPRWDERRIWDACLRLLIEGRIGGEEIVTPVVRFEDLLEEYPKIATAPDAYVKLGVEYAT